MAYELSNQLEEQSSTSTTPFLVSPRPAIPLQLVVNPNGYLSSPHYSFGFASSPATWTLIGEQNTKSLLQFMASERLFPTPEDDLKRKDAIDKLKQIVLTWINKIAFQRRLIKDQVQTSATILAYGSYGLGAHGTDSDIDALCVGPSYATRAEDFFVVLSNMLQDRPEVSELHCIKDAKVPLMRFKFSGISVDLPYTQLKVSSVPDNVDLLDPCFLRNIDGTSWKSCSGVRANMRILQLVPNVEKFQYVLRCIKLWAKRRGVYSNVRIFAGGVFGGIHIVVLMAYVCQRHSNGSLSYLISTFFDTFAHWPWPTPVMLEEGLLPMVSNIHHYMQIQLPGSPDEFVQTNITLSTFQKIRSEFQRGFSVTRDYLKRDIQWSILFEPFPYSTMYRRFVRILLTAPTQDKLGDWVGWVKSRFRSLLFRVLGHPPSIDHIDIERTVLVFRNGNNALAIAKHELEDLQVICDPNPTEYLDPAVKGPTTVFYWGLHSQTGFVSADPIEKYFRRHLTTGYQGTVGEVELSIVNSNELPKNAQFQNGSAWSKAYWRNCNYNLYRRPVFSSCCPRYIVGYAVSGDGPAVDG